MAPKKVEFPARMGSTEAAGFAGISDALMRRYCRDGRIGTKIGRNYVITAAQLEKFLETERTVGRPPGERAEPEPEPDEKSEVQARAAQLRAKRKRKASAK